MSRQKISVVTGSRAEYGILRPLLSQIQNESEFDLEILSTGMHLSPEFGSTYRQIESDGFSIAARVEMLLSSDSAVGIAKSMGLGTMGFSDAFAGIRPNLCIVLGDRFEILSAVQAALFLKIPVAHLHGGEVTEGAFDDAIRHSITKMSHLHFVAAEEYRRRVIQLGERPDRVYNVGALSLDGISKMRWRSRSELESELGIRLGPKNFLVTFHPETLNSDGPEKAISHLFRALDRHGDAHIFFTRSNADPQGRWISSAIDEYASARKDRVWVFTALGQERYLNLAAHVNVVIGNSSSGLIEVPVLKKPTVNIGDRQKGRLRASSVIDCAEEETEIALALSMALSQEFTSKLKQVVSPYGGDGLTAKRIVDVLKPLRFSDLIRKKFHDLF